MKTKSNIYEQARVLLEELQSTRLEVIKVPARDGGYVRLTVNRNCDWYRDFCASYTRFRRQRDRTIIKRCHTITALKRIQAGDRLTEYAKRLLVYVQSVEIPEKDEKHDYPIEVDGSF